MRQALLRFLLFLLALDAAVVLLEIYSFVSYNKTMSLCLGIIQNGTTASMAEENLSNCFKTDVMVDYLCASGRDGFILDFIQWEWKRGYVADLMRRWGLFLSFFCCMNVSDALNGLVYFILCGLPAGLFLSFFCWMNVSDVLDGLVYFILCGLPAAVLLCTLHYFIAMVQQDPLVFSALLVTLVALIYRTWCLWR